MWRLGGSVSYLVSAQVVISWVGREMEPRMVPALSRESAGKILSL